MCVTVTISRALAGAGAREAVAERSGGWSCELMIKDISRHHTAAVWVILGIRNSREKYYSGKLATLSLFTFKVTDLSDNYLENF